MRPSIHSQRYRTLRDLLREARVEKGLRQSDVAAALNVPQSYVSKFESGERRLDVIEFIDLCAVLGLDPLAVLGRLGRPS